VIEAAHGRGSAWWDRALASGDRFRPEITAALDAARAAVVVWTDGSVDSDWVYAEADRPDTFLPDLATSISVMSDALAALERPAEAAAAATAALATLAPFIERYPESFGGLARTIAADVLKYSQAAGVEPDRALLDRIARALKPR